MSFAKCMVGLALTLSAPAGLAALAQATNPPSPASSASSLVCDLTTYTPTNGITADVSGDVLLVQWPGAGNERLRLGLGIVDGTPTIAELAIRVEGQAWMTLATDARIEFKTFNGHL